MDAEQPALLWTPEIALRSKEQVIQEDWKVPDAQTASLKQHGRNAAPANAKTWTTLKSHTLTLFYQAPSSPPIPSFEEMEDIITKSRRLGNRSSHAVYKLGDAVVKFSGSPGVIEVSM
jgi:hypothetical protein